MRHHVTDICIDAAQMGKEVRRVPLATVQIIGAIAVIAAVLAMGGARTSGQFQKALTEGYYAAAYRS